ncbi:uncharacterized protein MONBRDRAFT_35916 [Monosiga brevicollis MX1]|uniref:STIL N-terminal domain-containing protein n=1 Tax=Monosiga brevicollis TaxID=81824 RepID=A9USK7_MONBE|nr:uncharacterized protein MONBRDRAFT_35916 [Monosiga brevicollis MX1]EDQ91796.1 predicted protein [Monosiga brevicollis MX1]|eukprot:XP_001743082.1 hypothetical protein [Monosiga brevicollis MX1]
MSYLNKSQLQLDQSVNVIDASGSVKHVGVIVFLHLASDQPYVEIELLAAEQFVPGEPNDNLRRLTLYLPEGSYSGHFSVCIRSGAFSHHTHVLEVINPAAPALRNGQLVDALREDDVAEQRLFGLVQPATEDHSAYVDVEWSFRLDQTQEVLLLLRNICVADSAHKVSFGEDEDVQTTVFGVINCDQLAVGRARVYLPSPRGDQNVQKTLHDQGDISDAEIYCSGGGGGGVIIVVHTAAQLLTTSSQLHQHLAALAGHWTTSPPSKPDSSPALTLLLSEVQFDSSPNVSHTSLASHASLASGGDDQLAATIELLSAEPATAVLTSQDQLLITGHLSRISSSSNQAVLHLQISARALGLQTHGCHSGYLTMDGHRRARLVLNDDPRATTLPLVGIWCFCPVALASLWWRQQALNYWLDARLKDRVFRDKTCCLLAAFGPGQTCVAPSYSRWHKEQRWGNFKCVNTISTATHLNSLFSQPTWFELCFSDVEPAVVKRSATFSLPPPALPISPAPTAPLVTRIALPEHDDQALGQRELSYITTHASSPARPNRKTADLSARSPGPTHSPRLSPIPTAGPSEPDSPAISLVSSPEPEPAPSPRHAIDSSRILHSLPESWREARPFTASPSSHRPPLTDAGTTPSAIDMAPMSTRATSTGNDVDTEEEARPRQTSPVKAAPAAWHAEPTPHTSDCLDLTFDSVDEGPGLSTTSGPAAPMHSSETKTATLSPVSASLAPRCASASSNPVSSPSKSQLQTRRRQAPGLTDVTNRACPDAQLSAALPQLHVCSTARARFGSCLECGVCCSCFQPPLYWALQARLKQVLDAVALPKPPIQDAAPAQRLQRRPKAALRTEIQPPVYMQVPAVPLSPYMHVSPIETKSWLGSTSAPSGARSSQSPGTLPVAAKNGRKLLDTVFLRSQPALGSDEG